MAVVSPAAKRSEKERKGVTVEWLAKLSHKDTAWHIISIIITVHDLLAQSHDQ